MTNDTQNYLNFNEFLNQLKDMSRNTREQGLLFEKVVKSYLENDAVYGPQFRKIWLWSDWPERKGIDTGIDLVAEKPNGSLCAIQAKFHNNPLEKNDINSFLEAMSRKKFSSGMLVHTAPSISSVMMDVLIEHDCTVIDRSKMAASNVDWPNIAKKITEIRQGQKYDLRPHQNRAVNDVINGFKSADRGKLIMACGTGKTFTSLRIAENMAGEGKSVLYMVPSISLMKQTMREWAEQKRVNHNYVGICSDVNVGKDDEDITISELEIPVTTKPCKIMKALVSRQPSAVSRQPSAVSRQPSAVSRQPSAVSRQPSANKSQCKLFFVHISQLMSL